MSYLTKDSVRLIGLFLLAAVGFIFWAGFTHDSPAQYLGAAGLLVLLCGLTVLVNWIKYGKKS